MRYRINVGPCEFVLTEQEYQDLKDCMAAHENNGYRDGWSEVGRAKITEVGGAS